MSLTALAAALTVSIGVDYQALLDEQLAAQDTPGISAVVSVDREPLFAGGTGVADIESSRTMQADTVLYAGSLSKVLTAILTLHLVERGEISLADPVAGIAAARADPAPVTVAQLLTHAAGLEREGDFGYWFSADFPDRARLSRYLRQTSLRSPPGQALHYSNVGYATLGMVIEDATGRPFSDAVKTLLARPLELTATGAPGPAPAPATGYTPTGRVLPSATRPFAGVGREVGERRVREYHDAAAMSPAFGIYTSADDLGKVARFLLSDAEHPLLSPAMRVRMRTRQPSGWGLGLKVGEFRGNPVARHEGWFAAHRSHLLLDADSGVSVVVLTNSDGGKPALIAEALYLATLAALQPPR